MARNTSQLTVIGQEEEIEKQPHQGLTRRKKQEIVPVEQAQAVAIEELITSFDPDLRMAIIQRLVREHEAIKTLSTKELKLSKALELARLEAVDHAREQGIQQARAEIAAKKKEQAELTKQQFINVELPQLLDALSHLPFEKMQEIIDGFASQLGVKLRWEDLPDGEFRCVPL